MGFHGPAHLSSPRREILERPPGPLFFLCLLDLLGDLHCGCGRLRKRMEAETEERGVYIFGRWWRREKRRTDSSPRVERLQQLPIDPGNLELLRPLYLNHHEPHTGSTQIKPEAISLKAVISQDKMSRGCICTCLPFPFISFHIPSVHERLLTQCVSPREPIPSNT